MKYTVESLRQFGIQVAEKAGMSHQDAETLLKNLLFSDMRGVRSHGMTRLSGYVTRICLLYTSIYIGAVSGGLIAAILINIPGTPASVATCFDGTPLARKGQAYKALGVGTVFSFLGTIFGILILVFVSPIIANFALKFGPAEYFSCLLYTSSKNIDFSKIGTEIAL